MLGHHVFFAHAGEKGKKGLGCISTCKVPIAVRGKRTFWRLGFIRDEEALQHKTSAVVSKMAFFVYHDGILDVYAQFPAPLRYFRTVQDWK
jgi:hypothetical protein